MRPKARSQLIIIAVALAFAFLTISSGLDRVSKHEFAVARFVTAPFAAEAYRAKAAAALRAGELPEAVTAAKHAVVADPIDQRSVALLGAAHLALGQRIEADRAFRTAARFGWRDPLTQLYLMDQAQKSGEVRLAALRLDAVLRHNPRFPLRDLLLAQFEVTPEGRAALAARLALRPAWTVHFTDDGGTLPLTALRNRAEVLKAYPGSSLGCETILPLVNRLDGATDVLIAKQIWLRHCPTASPGLADPHFTALSRERRTPFEWNLAASGDITAVPVTASGTGLVARVSGAASRMIAWQMLTLRPGRYRLSWTAVDRTGLPASGLSFSLSCKLGERIALRSRAPAGSGRFIADLEVDGACPGQYLAIWMAPSIEEVRVDAIALQSIAKPTGKAAHSVQ